jgi:hypothetical protein
MADNSLERTGSLSDTSPLIRSSTPVVNDRETPTFPRTSIFTYAVICILFTELCERLTFYGISGNLVLFATEGDHLKMTPAQASILAYLFQGTVVNYCRLSRPLPSSPVTIITRYHRHYTHINLVASLPTACQQVVFATTLYQTCCKVPTSPIQS